MKMKRLSLAVAVVVLLLAGTAQAFSVTYNYLGTMHSTNFPPPPTFVTLPLFDPSIGILDSVDFSLTATVMGNASFESLDSSPATVTTHLQAQVTVQKPDLSTLAVLLPTVSHSDAVTAFDGVIDFGGTSGKSYTGISGTDSFFDVFTSLDGALFTMFEGVGNISFPVSAIGASSGSGAGNLVLLFTTNAKADGEVTYNYHTTSTVPLPAALWLLGSGLIGLVGFGRKLLG
jgi:hypothetical protein